MDELVLVSALAAAQDTILSRLLIVSWWPLLYQRRIRAVFALHHTHAHTRAAKSNPQNYLLLSQQPHGILCDFSFKFSWNS